MLGLRAHNMPPMEREYLFHPLRKWRFDFAYPDLKIALEVQGGLWTQGRHSRAEGYTADCDKANKAQLLGWIVLRITPAHIADVSYIPLLADALALRHAAVTLPA